MWQGTLQCVLHTVDRSTTAEQSATVSVRFTVCCQQRALAARPTTPRLLQRPLPLYEKQRAAASSLAKWAQVCVARLLTGKARHAQYWPKAATDTGATY